VIRRPFLFPKKIYFPEEPGFGINGIECAVLRGAFPQKEIEK